MKTLDFEFSKKIILEKDVNEFLKKGDNILFYTERVSDKYIVLDYKYSVVMRFVNLSNGHTCSRIEHFYNYPDISEVALKFSFFDFFIQ